MTTDISRFGITTLNEDDVFEIVEKYPYFHWALLFRLLKTSNDNPDQFITNSSSIAIALPNRDVLVKMYSELLSKKYSNQLTTTVNKENDENISVENIIHSITHKLSDINKRFIGGNTSNIGYSIESEKAKRVDLNNEQKRKNILIDEFIKKSPSISRSTTPISGSFETYTKPNIDTDKIVSETLAIIYTKQGNIDKAKDTYLRLIELNPDKSDYFNTKLKALNNERDTKDK